MRTIRAAGVLCLIAAPLFFDSRTAATGQGEPPAIHYRIDPNPGRMPIPEPYAWLNGGSFSGPQVPVSPDPLIAYRWDAVSPGDDFQIYALKPVSVASDNPSSFSNLSTLTEDNPSTVVSGAGSARLDFGIVCAGWLEMESPDLDGAIEMSISEYNEPAIVNDGPENPRKTKTPVKYGNVYRLELNAELFEGVRFGWIHVLSCSRSWHITNVRLVCRIRPVNYRGSFSSDDSLLDRIWYTGAYTARVNFRKDHIGALLMDRGDRYLWVGDAHPAQATALASFADYEYVRRNIVRTAAVDNGIESYALYWILSLVEYYRYTGDGETLASFIPEADKRLVHAGAVYDSGSEVGFFGWDERLGAGFEAPDTEEPVSAFRMLFLRACREWAGAMDQSGRPDLFRKYSDMADEKILRLRSGGPWFESYGVHACAEAVNAGFLTAAETAAMFAREFADSLNRLSYSPFNQYFVIQALARMGRHDEALAAIRKHWGGQIFYGGTTFFEVYRPDWNEALGPNDPVPNNQCGFTSLAHAWGSGVTKWLSEEILGIKPVRPGFAVFDVLPHPGTTITRVGGKIVSPKGEIEAAFDLGAGTGMVRIPLDTKARIGFPKAGRSVGAISVNGTLVWDGVFHPVQGIGSASEDADFVYFIDVQPGTYAFLADLSGAVPPYVDPPLFYAASFLGVDAETSGNWGGIYGKDGYILFNYDGAGRHVSHLPAYAASVSMRKSRDIFWAADMEEPRAPARDASNGFPRNAGGLKTGDSQATFQTFTVDILLKERLGFRVALYFLDWDDSRRAAVELFDYETKKIVSPLKTVAGFRGGKYLIYSYDRSLRIRINQIRGVNAVLSALFFDPPEPSRQAIMSLSPTRLLYGAVSGGSFTPTQTLSLSFSKPMTTSWQAVASVPWIEISPAAGSGNALLSVAVDPSGLDSGTYAGAITIADPGALNSPRTVSVVLSVYVQGGSKPPFGTVDTPADGTWGIEGSLPVSGWALDDIETSKVDIWRDPVGGEPVHSNGYVYVGDAYFVDGARPDVEAAQPGYPLNRRAGWGFMILTNFLPNGGNGTFRIHALAHDVEGYATHLGTRTITCDNAHATLPFGTIDTPTQGGAVSGNAYVNFGWALTPMPRAIPSDGSTLMVWVDGAPVGRPSYGWYRADIASLFPGYANANGAVGYFYLNASQYSNELHTIAWSVTDDGGRNNGIGSRYFTIVNPGSGATGGEAKDAESGGGRFCGRRLAELAIGGEALIDDLTPLGWKKGFETAAVPQTAAADIRGRRIVEIGETEPVVIAADTNSWFDLQAGRGPIGLESGSAGADPYEGYIVMGGYLNPLPAGSRLDRRRGLLTWLPGPGFVGDYDLAIFTFAPGSIPVLRRITVRIVPKFHRKSFPPRL